MNRITLSILLILLLCNARVKSQTEFLGKEFSIGVAPLYFSEVENQDIFGNHYYQEFLANIHFNARLSRNWFAGVRSHVIHIRQKVVPAYENTHFINGLFAQYSIIASGRVRVSFELSYSFGDHCNCEPNQPLYGESLQYLGFGITADLQFLKKYPSWWINLGLQTYHINGYHKSYGTKMPVSPVALIGQFTTSAIGIQYKFGNKKTFTSP